MCLRNGVMVAPDKRLRATCCVHTWEWGELSDLLIQGRTVCFPLSPADGLPTHLELGVTDGQPTN